MIPNLYNISLKHFKAGPIYRGLVNPAFAYLAKLRDSKGSQAVLRAKRAERLALELKEFQAKTQELKSAGLTSDPAEVVPAKSSKVVYF